MQLLLDSGGLQEIQDIYNKDIKNIKAIGIKEIIMYLNGQVSYFDAIQAAQKATRQYAKRQLTWFNNQMSYDFIISKVEEILDC